MPRFLAPITVAQEFVTGNETISGSETILGATSGKDSYWTTVSIVSGLTANHGVFTNVQLNGSYATTKLTIKSFPIEDVTGFGLTTPDGTTYNFGYDYDNFPVDPFSIEVRPTIDNTLSAASLSTVATINATNLFNSYYDSQTGIIYISQKSYGVTGNRNNTNADTASIDLDDFTGGTNYGISFVDGSTQTTAFTGIPSNLIISSVSAISLSGTHYGDGSKLTGISSSSGVTSVNGLTGAVSLSVLYLSGGTLTGGLSGTTGLFTTSLSAPELSGVHYGDGSKLSNLPATSLVSTVVADLSVGSISAGQTILSGTTFQQFVEKLLTATFNPTFTAPTASLASNLAASVEAGTTGITLTVTLNRGSITGKTVNGIWQPATFQDYRSGAATNYVIIGVNNSTSNVYTSAAAIIGDGSNVFSSTVTYSAGPQPVDSKGNNYSTALIGSSLSPTVTVTGRRKAFYGINNTGDSSSTIRSLTGNTLNPANGTIFSISIPIGATSVVFAYPATLQDVTSVKESVLNADVKSAFTQTTVAVEGLSSYTAINYKVYRYVPAESYASAATYTITI